MSQIHFFYGTVSSAKSAELLTKAHYMESIGKRIVCLKPSEERDGDFIKSRAGLSRPCINFNDWEKALSPLVEYVFIDEVQFTDSEDLKDLVEYCQDNDISIFAYGLRTSITGNLFPSIGYLMAVATHITENKALCAKCGKRKAIYNVRLNEAGQVDNSGPIVAPGFNYEGRCYKCKNT